MLTCHEAAVTTRRRVFPFAELVLLGREQFGGARSTNVEARAVLAVVCLSMVGLVSTRVGVRSLSRSARIVLEGSVLRTPHRHLEREQLFGGVFDAVVILFVARLDVSTLHVGARLGCVRESRARRAEDISVRTARTGFVFLVWACFLLGAILRW